MILKENHNYTFCTAHTDDGQIVFTGAFIGYELLGTITFIKIFSAVTGRFLLLNPSAIVWMECVNLDANNHEDMFEDSFDHVAVKEKKEKKMKSKSCGKGKKPMPKPKKK